MHHSMGDEIVIAMIHRHRENEAKTPIHGLKYLFAVGPVYLYVCMFVCLEDLIKGHY